MRIQFYLWVTVSLFGISIKRDKKKINHSSQYTVCIDNILSPFQQIILRKFYHLRYSINIIWFFLATTAAGIEIKPNSQD